MDDKGLKQAYAEVYASIDTKNQRTLLGNEVTSEARKKWYDALVSSGKAETKPGTPETKPGTPGVGSEATEAKNGTVEGKTQAIIGTSGGNKKAEEDVFQKLIEAQSTWSDQSLSRNATAVRGTIAKSKDTATTWLKTRIDQLIADITDLKVRLGVAGGTAEESKMLALPVVNENGIVVTDTEVAVKPGKYN